METKTKVLTAIGGGAATVGAALFFFMNEPDIKTPDVAILNENNIYIQGHNAGLAKDARLNWPKYKDQIDEVVKAYKEKQIKPEN